MARKRNKRATKSDKRIKEPAKLEHEDDVFAQIADPKIARKSLLEGAKISLESLLQYQSIVTVRKQKTLQLAILKKELDSLRLLTRTLSELMPIAKDEQLRSLTGIESPIKADTKEFIDKDASSEFAGIEKALRAIQSRLQQL